MAVGISAASKTLTFYSTADSSSILSAQRRRYPVAGECFVFSPLSPRPFRILRRRSLSTAFFVLEKSGNSTGDGEIIALAADEVVQQKKREDLQISHVRAAERRERKKSERTTYLIAAVMSSLGITAMAVAAVYYRFAWQMEVSFVKSFPISRN